MLADEASGRLFIADSNHHRVLVATLEGRVTDVIGAGAFGWNDGAFEAVRFYRPQRAADLSTRRVSTLAGTGRHVPYAGLRRASAVRRHGRRASNLDDRSRSRARDAVRGIRPEARVDGSIDDAAFAQPSGLALAASTLYVADAESNVIRAVALPPENRVRTLAGGDLFEFGDVNGVGDAVRLQHHLGIAWADGRLYIADTYNHRIKVIDPVTRRVTSLAGDGETGQLDGPADRAPILGV